MVFCGTRNTVNELVVFKLNHIWLPIGFSESHYEIFMGIKFYESFEKSFQYERNNSKIGKKTNHQVFFKSVIFNQYLQSNQRSYSIKQEQNAMGNELENKKGLLEIELFKGWSKD